MIPVDFEGTNLILVKPKNWSDEDCSALPVFSAEDAQLKTKMYVSCWIPSEKEMKEIMEKKEIWITVVGASHPPILVEGINPFKKETRIIS